ncbi:MAG TPA: cupredoxin domain-containing protein [Candidatus Limnocylindria bacterium]|nr:cupredoxin domain-containing protein [Candidatus Limnocylindria bacterium]
MLPRTLKTRAIGALLAVTFAVGACSPSSGTATNPPPTVSSSADITPSSAATAATATATPAATADVATSIIVRDFKLEPSSVSITAAAAAGFEVTNAGPTVHNVKIRDQAGAVLFGSRNLREGESEIVVHSIAPGTYILFCSLPGHESLGIKGRLTVTAP